VDNVLRKDIGDSSDLIPAVKTEKEFQNKIIENKQQSHCENQKKIKISRFEIHIICIEFEQQNHTADNCYQEQ